MTTKTAQFTPGPWVAALGERLNTDVYHIDKQGNRVFVAEFATQADAVLGAAAPAMYEALQNLLEWAKGNRGAREGNPYCKPEVRQALKVLASIQGKKDYLDAATAPQAEGKQ